jgi:hypothetical protein
MEFWEEGNTERKNSDVQKGLVRQSDGALW